MKPRPCFKCGRPAAVNHHVVPRIYGGVMTVPLCEECHGKVYALELLDHRELTRAGLAAYKARGGVLGKPENWSSEDRLRLGRIGAAKVKADADEAYADLVPLLQKCRGMPLRAIAALFNEQGSTTRQGHPWNHGQVRRILIRYGL